MQKRQEHTQSILTANLWKLMVRLSLPGILGMSIISLGSFIDAIFVGQWVGIEAIAGISLVFPLTVINNGVVSLIAAGTTSVYSRALGANDSVKIQRVFGNLLSLCLILSALLTAAGLFFAEELLALMGGTGEVLTYGKSYYQVIMAGAFFSVFGLSSNALIRAEGKVKQAMIFAGLAVVINVVLTPAFIHFFDLGIQGAAWGTVTSMVVYSFMNIQYFLSDQSNIPASSIGIRFHKAHIVEVLHVGLSAFLLQAVNFIRQTMIFRSMTYYGNAHDLAFLGATMRIFMFAVIPVFGILQALQPVVGMNYGASAWQRSIDAVKIFRTEAIGILLFVLLLCLFFPEQVLALILPDIVLSRKELFHFQLLMLVLPVLPFASTGIIFFQATGKGKIASYLSLGRELIFIPAIFLFPFTFGANGIFYAIFVENIVYTGIVYSITLRTFRRLHRAAKHTSVH